MNKLVSDLIDYTRTNLGSTMPIIHKAIDLEALCREAVLEQEAAHPEARFQMVANGDFAGYWDDNRIAQVLSNLLGNAVQHGSANEPVVLRLQARTDDVLLRVENRGKVIPPEKINAIFEPLVRLAAGPDQAHASSSLGIGLYIAREIVYAHGGAISVESTEEQGTVFAVTLPRRPRGDLPQHLKPSMDDSGRA